MDISIDRAYDLYDGIAENSHIWPTKKETSRKTASIHSIDSITSLAAQLEALTIKKLNT